MRGVKLSDLQIEFFCSIFLNIAPLGPLCWTRRSPPDHPDFWRSVPGARGDRAMFFPVTGADWPVCPVGWDFALDARPAFQTHRKGAYICNLYGGGASVCAVSDRLRSVLPFY